MRRAVVLAGIGAVALLLAWILVRPTRPQEPSVAASARPTPRTTTLAASPPPRRPPGAATPPDPRRSSPAAPVPSSPSSGARALQALDERFAVYEAMTLDYDLPAGATREEEDRLLVERLKEVSGEAARLEKAYQDVISLHDDPRAAVLATIAIGDCKDALREDLLDAPAPSYLTADQAEVYRAGLDAKAAAAGSAAREAWDRAAELAAAAGSDAEIEALIAGRQLSAE